MHMETEDAIRLLVERLYKHQDPDVIEALGVLSRKQRLINNVRRVADSWTKSGRPADTYDPHLELVHECAQHIEAYQVVLDMRGLVLGGVILEGFGGDRTNANLDRKISIIPVNGSPYDIWMKP